MYVTDCGAASLWRTVADGLVMVGAAIGAMIGGKTADKFGRKGAIMRVSFIGCIVFVFTVMSFNWPMLAFMRFLCGITLGAVSIAVPMYISELVPAEIRGGYGVLHQLMITMGIFTGIALGLAQTQTVDFKKGKVVVVDTVSAEVQHDFPQDQQITPFDLWYWRFILGFAIVPAIGSLAFFGACFRRFESPQWLMGKGRVEGVRHVFLSLRQSDDIEGEIAEMQETQDRERAENVEDKSFIWALKSDYYRIGVIVGCLLSAAQQFSGINMIITASNELYQSAGAKPAQVTLCSCFTALLNVMMTMVAVKLMDAAGRRTLLIISGAGQTLSMGLAFLCSILADTGKVDASGTCAYVMIAAINAFIISFAVGFGPTVWVYLAEIYPKAMRGSCVSFGIFINWMSSATVVFVLANLFKKLGGGYENSMRYGTLTLLNFAGLMFVIAKVVETKGSSIEDSPLYNRGAQKARTARPKAAAGGNVDTSELLPVSATEGTSVGSAE